MEIVEEALARGRGHHQAGRLGEAEAVYQGVVDRSPDCAEGWRLLGLVAHETGRHADAVARLERACGLEPGNAVMHNGLGIAKQGQGGWERALAHFTEAIRLAPGYAEAHQNRGASLNALRRPEEAVACFREALRLRPDLFPARMNLAQTLERLGRLEEAAAVLREGLQVQPGVASGQQALGRLLAKVGRPLEALHALQRAAELGVKDPQQANEVGNQLQDLGRFEEAEAAYCLALRADPAFVQAHGNLGYLLADQGRMDESRGHYEQALRLGPSARLRVVAETALAPIYQSAEEMDAAREYLAANLRRLDEEGIRVDPTREVMPTLFYLAYQGRNDRELQAGLAGLAEEKTAELGLRRLSPRHPGDPKHPGGKRIHVGFLSRNFKNHTIGNLAHGVIARLDRTTFQVTVLSAGRYDDELGTRIRQSADRFVGVPPNLPAALKTIAGQGLDVLFYTDVGMDPFTYTLALTRLAAVQCVTWGHPVTTGMAAMDYFISSVDLDTEAAQEHYTERLVRLPSPAVYYERPVLAGPARSRSSFGVPEEAHVYACPQTLFKLHPDFDALLGAILRQDPQGILVLIEGRYPTWNRLLWQRFDRTLADVRERIRVVPRLGRPGFLQLLAVTDVLLDPIHFGGGNSSYEGLALGVPIVTLPAAYLRGRITYALYRKMGTLECVAATPEEYVRLAVELGTDPGRRGALQARLRDASSVLFEDAEAVRALEQFLVRAVEEGAQNHHG
jgi:predicted O-linked N-acetylglucosamine transferase (SPINDLY family)